MANSNLLCFRSRLALSLSPSPSFTDLAPSNSKYADQKKVFEDLGRGVLQNAWQGYNCSLFAYGQTGSGKSYSMVGYGSNKGIVPVTCEQLFIVSSLFVCWLVCLPLSLYLCLCLCLCGSFSFFLSLISGVVVVVVAL